MAEIFQLKGLTNQAFFDAHARPGRIGVIGGSSLIDRLIRRGQRHAIAGRQWSIWSHTFLFEGRRADGHHWLIESDLTFHRKHVQLGVQENRVAKYFDDAQHPAVAVLDLGLSPAQAQRLLGRALELMATGTRFSIREIFGTMLALHRPGRRADENRLARQNAFYCSAFIRHLFDHIGLELAPGIAVKNTTPEDVAQTAAAQKKWVMIRPAGPVASGSFRRLRLKQGLNCRMAAPSRSP